MTSLEETCKRLISLSKSATPGKWTAFENGSWGGKGYGISIGDDESSLDRYFYSHLEQSDKQNGDNAIYIAATSPDVIKQLCESWLLMKEALEGVLTTGALEWYTASLRLPEVYKSPLDTGIRGIVSNAGMDERVKLALHRARKVLSELQPLDARGSDG